MAKETRTERTTCPKCNGAGRTGSEYYDRNGNLRRAICTGCNGAGRVTVTTTEEVADETS